MQGEARGPKGTEASLKEASKVEPWKERKPRLMSQQHQSVKSKLSDERVHFATMMKLPCTMGHTQLTNLG